MADGRVVFPVKFDLDAAVKEASGDADRVLKRLGTMIASRPLKLGVEIDMPKGGWDKKLGSFGDGSINAMRKEMNKLVEQWNKLSEAQRITNQQTGQYTAEATKILNRYSQLVAASESYARGLEQIAAAAKKSADAEIKSQEKSRQAKEKALAKGQATIAMLKAEETSISAVAAKMKFWQDVANKFDFGTKQYQNATAELNRLGAQYQRLKSIMSGATGNQGKDIFNAEKIKSTLKGAESSIEQVKAKLKAVDQILAKVPADSFGFRRASEEGQRLLKLLRDMEAQTPKNQLKAQEQLQKEWLAAKDQRERERQREAEQAVANANRENQARQAAYNRQREAGLERQRILKAEETSISAVTAKLQLQQQRLNDAKVGTAKYERIRVEVERLTKKLGEMREALEAAGKRAEALRALREILSASEKTISGINGKLQIYQQRLQGLEVGSQKFNKTAAEVRRLSEELQKANQYLADFQSKAFRGLSTNFTAKQTEAVQNLRNQIDAIDKKFNSLYQNGRATNADGTFTDRVNNMLKERARLQSEINKMMMTAADAQIQREKEINRIQEQRKAKAQAIADKKKAETKAVQDNIAKLKEERRVLNQQESSIKAITDKLNIMQRRLNTTNMKSGEFEKIAKEVERLTKKLDEAKRKVAELTGQSTSGSSTQARNARKVSDEYSRQLGYVDRLIRRMAIYTSIGMIGGFLTKVREVTAQFELQRVSLGAILQDQNKANQLFSEIKSFALKSPVSILDLTKYTKQLAAYKIGYDELFETTKKLTDVSVGLGVSMDRVVLAYGQVRATGHLRASEIRQFTEMGVPIVEELAAKLTKMNGELVTAADVMDMVSKRAISFGLVKEVFDDMTSAGGAFYNMQEKQGNTLYGLWAKLGDAASVMYNEIGSNSVVNGAMKSMIAMITAAMKNWRMLSGEIAIAAIGFIAYKSSSALATASTVAASKATRDYARAQVQLNAAQKTGATMQVNAAKYAMRAAAANRIAATSTNVWTAAKYRLIGATNSLKAALAGNWVTLALTAVVAIGYAIYSAYEKANRLKNALAEIKSETSVLQGQSVRNFEYLADSAVKAADGSKKQKDALDELRRTYGDMLPAESLRIENLRALKGNYDSLTEAVREYIAAEQENKAINTINETEGAVQTSMQKKLRGVMTDIDLGEMALSDIEVERFFRAFEKTALDTTKTIKEQFVEAYRLAGLEGAEEMWKEVKAKNRAFFTVSDKLFNSEEDRIRYHSAIGELSRSLADQQRHIEAVRQSYAELTQDLGVYTQSMQNYNDWVQKNLNAGDTMLQQRQNDNMRILGMESMIQQEMQRAGLVYREEWANIVESVDPNDLNRITTLNMEAILAAIDPNTHPELYRYIQAYQKIYNELVPRDAVVQQIRAKFFQIANGLGDSMDLMGRFLWNGQDKLEDHIKTLGDNITNYEAEIFRMQQAIAKGGLYGASAQLMYAGRIEDLTKLVSGLKELMKFEQSYIKLTESENKGGRKSDPRLQLLKEEISLVQKLYNEYKQLEKQEGMSKATADMNALAKDTIDMLSKKYGIGLPRTAMDVVSALEILYGKMAQLPKRVFPALDKDLKELRWTIEKVDIDESQKNIETELKRLAERISRTKTAREFYEKTLSTTGDYSLASKVAESIFGQNGSELRKALAQQVRGMTNGIELPDDIISADNVINYKALRQFAEANKNELGKMYDELIKISNDGQKDLAKTYEGYLKDLEKAKSYSDKRIELARYTANQIAEINASPLPEDEKKRLTAGYREREDKEAAKLEWEAFKDMPMYVQMFEDLDNASTTMLHNMQDMLNKLKGKWGEALEPTQLKEMQSRLNAISEQLAKRNPFKAIGEGIGKIRALNKEYGSLKNVENKLTTATGQLIENKDALTAALQAEAAARQEYDKIVAESGADSAAAKSAKSSLDSATALVSQMRKNVNLTEQEVKLLQELIDKFKEANDEVDDGFKGIGEYVAKIKEAQDAIKGAVEEWSALGDDELWNAIFDGLDKMALSAEQGGEAVAAYLQGDYFTMVTKGISSVANLVSGIGKLFWGSKVAKANKEIKRQQEILEQLEYTYGRLEKAADRLFGTDYLQNYNQQIKVLQAQQEAYLKQAQAERSKGKKEDKEKTQEYLDNARDVADQIKDIESDLVAHFTGVDQASAARDFVQSWLEAKVAFANTADAIKSKYKDLIKNMVIEGAAAKVIDNILGPMYDKMGDLLNKGDIQGAIDYLMNGMDAFVEQADNGLNVLWKALEARGYDMKAMLGDVDSGYTGIAKDIARATSEEINVVASIGNTMMYHTSFLPLIYQQMLAQSGGRAVTTTTNTVDTTALQTEAMNHYKAIEANTAATVARLDSVLSYLSRLVVTKGSVHGVNSFLKQ